MSQEQQQKINETSDPHLDNPEESVGPEVQNTHFRNPVFGSLEVDGLGDKKESAPEAEVRAPKPQASHVRVPPEFKCPILGTLMVHPVVASSGTSFERTALRNLLNTENPVDPVTKERLRKVMIPNNNLKKTIDNFVISLSRSGPWMRENPAPPDENNWIKKEDLMEYIEILFRQYLLEISELKRALENVTEDRAAAIEHIKTLWTEEERAAAIEHIMTLQTELDTTAERLKTLEETMPVLRACLKHSREVEEGHQALVQVLRSENAFLKETVVNSFSLGDPQQPPSQQQHAAQPAHGHDPLSNQGPPPRYLSEQYPRFGFSQGRKGSSPLNASAPEWKPPSPATYTSATPHQQHQPQAPQK